MGKVICLGYFDRGNCGDEAFKVAHDWLFGSGNVELRNGRLTPEDIAGRPVILGGGDVVAPFFVDWIPRGTPFSMLGVGLKYEQASIDLVRSRGEDYQHGWYRNRADVELCRAAGLAGDYTPDIVFALRDSYSRAPSPLLDTLALRAGAKRAIVCLADHANSRYELQDPRIAAYWEYFKWELALTLDRLVDELDVIFVPLSVYRNHLDHRFHYDVARRMKHRNRAQFITKALHPLDCLQLFASVDYVFSMKLHGNIFGMVTKRRCVNIGVGRKQQKLYEESNLQEISLEPYSFTKERFLRRYNAAQSEAILRHISELGDSNFNELVRLRGELRTRYGIAEREGTLQ